MRKKRRKKRKKEKWRKKRQKGDSYLKVSPQTNPIQNSQIHKMIILLTQMRQKWKISDMVSKKKNKQNLKKQENNKKSARNGKKVDKPMDDLILLMF